MRVRIKLALLMAALLAASSLAACRATPASSDKSAQSTPTAAAPSAGGTPAAQATQPAPPGGVEVALAAIAWPQGPAVAKVNGVDIKTDEWRQEVTRQLRLVTTQYQVDWNDKNNIDRLPMVLDAVIDHMIDLEVLRQVAARDGVTISDSEVQAEAENTRQQILAGGQYEDLDAFLKDNEMTQESFDQAMRQQALINRLMKDHGGPTEVEQVHAQHILVADEATAKEVLDKLNKGEKFEDLAKAYSTDTGNKDKGGDLGWFPKGAMVPEFENAAFALQKPGDTSGVVHTQYGYHIIRLIERGVRPLEEPMLSQVQQQNFTNWLATERSNAKVERLFTATPQATPTAPAAPAAVPSPTAQQ